MADPSSWQDVAIPGAHVLARCLGRGSVLMDPMSAAAFVAMRQALARVSDVNLSLMPNSGLQSLLGAVLELAIHLSDELDRRDVDTRQTGV